MSINTALTFALYSPQAYVGLDRELPIHLGDSRTCYLLTCF